MREERCSVPLGNDGDLSAECWRLEPAILGLAPEGQTDRNEPPPVPPPICISPPPVPPPVTEPLDAELPMQREASEDATTTRGRRSIAWQRMAVAASVTVLLLSGAWSNSPATSSQPRSVITAETPLTSIELAGYAPDETELPFSIETDEFFDIRRPQPPLSTFTSTSEPLPPFPDLNVETVDASALSTVDDAEDTTVDTDSVIPPRAAETEVAALPAEVKADPFIMPALAPAACLETRNFGTTVTWAHSPNQAGLSAEDENKLVFLIQVSGNFEIPEFT